MVTEAQRWQIIGLLKDKTKSQQEIADLVGVSRKCVFTINCNYERLRWPNNYQGLVLGVALFIQVEPISFDVVKNMIESIPKRVAERIKAKSDHLNPHGFPETGYA
ncbi:hypothetical protein BpHYR1_015775 [Brachionus plicatilis]|uniref:Uncharacterized protein n=1 Tax=Brachionus plicatilis TaxID=10195 RepID=A0A3M7P6E8_BRAPC|nr:hypothetical protein BpHYR1_015775 [Brachionus plicatilis]